MILFKIIGVFWFSICSMFSNGSNESSICDYKELDVQDSSLESKGAYTKTIDNRTGYIFMTLQEYLPNVDKINQFRLQMYNTFGTFDANGNQIVPAGVGVPDTLPHNEFAQPQPNYSFTEHYFLSPDHYGVSQKLFFYQDMDAPIQSFDFGFGNMFVCNHIKFEYLSDTSYPNTHSTYKFTFYAVNENNNFSVSAIQFYNPINMVNGNTYNGNLLPVQNIQPLTWYFDNIVNNFNDPLYRWGISFRSTYESVWSTIYNYQSTPEQEIYDNGYQAGYENANQDYYNVGYETGFANGQSTISQESYDAGYSAGMMDANGTNPYMNSIFSGIFQVGLLPVNVFLTMFNYEIFGINVSGLVSGLLTMSIIVIIFRFLFGGKSND